MVAQFSGLDQMCDCKECAENNADACYDDVGDSEEGVLAANYGTRGDDDGFRATVFSDVEIW